MIVIVFVVGFLLWLIWYQSNQYRFHIKDIKEEMKLYQYEIKKEQKAFAQKHNQTIENFIKPFLDGKSKLDLSGYKKAFLLHLADDNSHTEGNEETFYLRTFADLGVIDAAITYADIEGSLNNSWIQAFSYYKKAALLGNAYAQGKVSMCYGLGEGVTKDYHYALAWAVIGAENGDYYSNRSIELIREKIFLLALKDNLFP